MSGTKWQYAIAFIIIAVLLIGIGVVVTQQINGVTSAFSTVTEETAPALIALGQLESASFRMLTETNSIAALGMSGDEDELEEIASEAEELDEYKESFDQWLAEYRRFAEDDEELDLADQLEEHGEIIYALSREAVGLVQSGASTDDILEKVEELEEAEGTFTALAEEAITIEQGELVTENAAALRSSRTALWLTLASLGIAVVLTAVAGLVAQRRAADLHANVELAAARDEALAASRQKSEFLASMSHELRTPLNAILNFNEMVATGMVGEVNDEQKELLEISLNSAQHLLGLINDVLDMSKIQSGMLNLFREESVDLHEELRTVIATAQALISDKPVQFIAEIDPALPAIPGDKRRIRQILLNLVSNAVKFTAKGSITLSAKVQNGEVVFIVADTGSGIAKEDHALIFEPFVQTTEGVQHSNGTGLGLPITKWLTEAHGGHITLESEIGHGSTFRVALPATSTAPAMIPVPTALAVNGSNGHV